MRLFEENQEIIKKLEYCINNMCQAEIEGKISKNEIEAEKLDHKIYDGFNQVIRFTRRIYAVNQNIIDSAAGLSQEMAQMDQMKNTIIPSGEIYYIERPVNNRNFLVHNFYEHIRNKYENEYEKVAPKNVAANPSERRLDKKYLDEEEQKKALILDKYLLICLISEQFEILINYVKRIQYNYISQNESGLCDE